MRISNLSKADKLFKKMIDYVPNKYDVPNDYVILRLLNTDEDVVQFVAITTGGRAKSNVVSYPICLATGKVMSKDAVHLDDVLLNIHRYLRQSFDVGDVINTLKYYELKIYNLKE